MNEIEVAWLAGLIEGEGCFTRTRSSPVFALDMTDEDIVKKAAKLLGISKISISRRDGCKDAYICKVYGNRALEVMRLLFPFMGNRRQIKITELLEWADARPGIGHYKRG